METLIIQQKLPKRGVQKAIFFEISKQIREGRLRPGQKLPSIRALAAQLKVSKTTIESVYMELCSEGWVCSTQRKGYFINAWFTHLPASQNSRLSPVEIPQNRPSLLFNTGLPDLRLLPLKEMTQHTKDSLSRSDPSTKAIVSYIQQTKGVQDGTVVFTSGSQQAIFIALQDLMKQGKTRIAVEEYTYPRFVHAARYLGFTLVSMKLSEDGIDIDRLHDHVSNIDILYLSTQFQFPTTIQMPLDKKLELLRLAQDFGFTIIEDDYDNEFYYSTYPSSNLYALDSGKNVVHISTFSNLISPSIRVGYLIADEIRAIRYQEAKEFISGNRAPLEESIVDQWVKSGLFEKHFRRVRKEYKSRAEYIIKRLKRYPIIGEYFNLNVQISGGCAVWLRCVYRHPQQLKTFLEQHDLFLAWSDQFRLQRPKKSQWFIRVGFSSYRPNELDARILRLAKGLKAFKFSSS